MIDYLVNFIKNINFNKLVGSRIVKSDESRREKIYEYIDYVIDREVEKNTIDVIEINNTNTSLKLNNIYAIDSSSRTIDTPYLFIAIGSTTCVNRFRSIFIDYPDITRIFSNKEFKYKYIVLIPEITSFPETYYSELRNLGIVISNPNGTIYDYKYSKYVVLDELRLNLENNILEILLYVDELSESIILIDGAIYYTPPIIYHYNELHITRDKYIREYIESWRILVNKRIDLINKLYNEKNTYVIGIVKRLQHSNLLSRLDPLNVSTGNLNDEAYLSIYVDKLSRERGIKPYCIGPIMYNPSSDVIKLPIKKIYYFAIPRRSGYMNSSFRTYVFYRAEAINENIDIINPIIYDSIYSGSLIPLSILLADSRAKRITHVLTNYLLSKTGLPGESTNLYITL